MYTAMEAIFWLCLGGLIYVYAGYHLALSFIAALRPIRHQPDEAYTPSVTILFSAYNEIASLPEKIENLRALDYPRERLQILAASDASGDGTSEFLQAQPDVQAFITSERGGKNAALNAMLPHASGEVLFFTDANTLLDPAGLRAATRHFSDPAVGMVTGRLIFTRGEDDNAVGRGTGAYWLYENSIKRAENRMGSVLVGSGSLLAARRELIGCLDPRVANDFEIPMRIGARGLSVLFEPECIGYEKPHTDLWEEVRRTSRIVSRGLRGFITLAPLMARSPLRLWQFVSHKMLRWFTLPMCIGLLIGAAALRGFWLADVVYWTGLLILAAALSGVGMIALKLDEGWNKPFTLLGHFLLMHAGAVWGLCLALAGKTPAAWNLPQSSR
ncbi:MAG: glycosyltransferase [bacterium]|nr:glycosyltransferase [bacterium]